MKRNKENYSWNYRLLYKMYRQLKNKKRNNDEEIEYQFLKDLLAKKHMKETNFDRSNTSFLENFNRDKQILNQEYIIYLQELFDYYDREKDEIYSNELSKLNLDKNYIFESIHDFYYSLNRAWWKYFMNIYKFRNDFLSFSNYRSSSILLPSSKVWLANINYTGTIADAFDTAHEVGHGIADQISQFNMYNPHSFILIDLFPIVTSIIYLLETKDRKYIDEANFCLLNYNSCMLDFMEEIKIKYNIINTFPNITNELELEHVILSEWKEILPAEYITELFSKDVEENICYAYPFLLALELVELYYQDKELFIFKMNYILNSKMNCFEITRELNLIKKITT